MKNDAILLRSARTAHFLYAPVAGTTHIFQSILTVEENYTDSNGGSGSQRKRYRLSIGIAIQNVVLFMSY